MTGLYAPLLEHSHDRQGIADMNLTEHQTLGGAAHPLPEEGTVVPVSGMPEPNRLSVLTEAQGLVHGGRNEDYGHPLDDWTRTAGMISAMLAHKLKEPITAEDALLFMVCVKVSREINRPKRDNRVDGAGYFECLDWVIDERARRG